MNADSSKWFWRMLLIILVSVFSSACTPPPPPPVKLVINPWVGYEPFVVTREHGLVSTKSLKLVELMSYSETLRAFKNGMAEAAALTLVDALHLAEDGFDLRIILLLSESLGADAVLAGTGVKQIEDLRNQRIGLEDTTYGRMLLQTMLQLAGMSLDDVKLMHTEAHLHRQMLRSGQISAVVTFEPMLSQLMSDGFSTTLFDSSSLPDKIIDVLVVRGDLSLARQQVLREAWEKGLQALKADRNNLAKDLSPALDISANDYLGALDSIQFFEASFSDAALTPQAMAQNQAKRIQNMQDLGLLDTTPDWHRLLARQ